LTVVGTADAWRSQKPPAPMRSPSTGSSDRGDRAIQQEHAHSGEHATLERAALERAIAESQRTYADALETARIRRYYDRKLVEAQRRERRLAVKRTVRFADDGDGDDGGGGSARSTVVPANDGEPDASEPAVPLSVSKENEAGENRPGLDKHAYRKDDGHVMGVERGPADHSNGDGDR